MHAMASRGYDYPVVFYHYKGTPSDDDNYVNPTIVGKDWFDGTPCERYVNCGNPFCNRRILASEDNEDKYLRGCSHECRVHPRNRYVLEHELTQDQVIERLAAIGESLDHSEVV